SGIRSRDCGDPACWRNPGTTVRPDLIRSSPGQQFLSSRPYIGINFGDLSIVEQLIPCRHSLLGCPVANPLQKLLISQFSIRICQARRQPCAECVDSVASVTVDMPPFPAIIDAFINL